MYTRKWWIIFSAYAVILLGLHGMVLSSVMEEMYWESWVCVVLIGATWVLLIRHYRWLRP